ncbi:TolB family protein [Streptomyces sp. 796.1]|uniref:TolB family protein n=1 Tax=Streptomyces sp. 796.1 TaxID=3163029 RepID=UPI0039C9F42A
MSLAHDGGQLARESYGYALSADGRWLTFTTDADQVVPGDTDGRSDTFVRDLATGRVERLALTGPEWEVSDVSASADGMLLAFAAWRTDLPPDQPWQEDLFLHDRRTHRTERLLPPNPHPDKGLQMPVISANGRVVAFQSVRADLVPGDTNGVADIFALDRTDGTIRRANVTSDGTQAPRAAALPVLSADGRQVGFISRSPVGDPGPGAGTSGVRGAAADAGAVGPAAEGVGRADRPGVPPGRAQDLWGERGAGAGTSDATGQARDVPQPGTGPRGPRKPRFEPMYVHDLRTGRTVAASVMQDGAEIGATTHALSADGRFALFASKSAAVVPGDTNGAFDLFLRDLKRGTTERVSLAPRGVEAAGDSLFGQLSGDGKTLVFVSAASNLVPDDTNGVDDLFARDLRTGEVERLSVRTDGTQSTTPPDAYLTDTHARTVVFGSADDHLVPGDTNAATDLFARHRRG